MDYINRSIERRIKRSLESGKSILLWGPRQTGKTTLINHLGHKHYLNLANLETRHRFERDPRQLYKEVQNLIDQKIPCPLIVLDEVQRLH